MSFCLLVGLVEDIKMKLRVCILGKEGGIPTIFFLGSRQLEGKSLAVLIVGRCLWTKCYLQKVKEKRLQKPKCL